VGAEPFAYHFTGVEFPGGRCARCGFVFLRRQPDEAGLERLYDADYFQCDYHCGLDERPYFATEELQTRASTRLLEWIEERARPGRILEVGCAGGYFLKTARDRGWSPTGVEISESASAFGRDQLDLDIRTGSLESAAFEDAAFDAAYLGDVLEHVPEPMCTLGELHRILRPGGVLLLAGPLTINSLDRRAGFALYRALGKTKILRLPPYHLTEFTPGTLRSALARAGFQTAWLRQSKIPPIWRNVRRRAPAEHVAKLIFDCVNILVTGVSGRLGDRFTALGIRGY
jgi:SAM-dependent methyltransferase